MVLLRVSAAVTMRAVMEKTMASWRPKKADPKPNARKPRPLIPRSPTLLNATGTTEPFEFPQDGNLCVDFDPRVLAGAVTVDSTCGYHNWTGTVGFVSSMKIVQTCTSTCGGVYACLAHVWRMFGACLAHGLQYLCNGAKFCPAVAMQTRNFCS